MITTTNLRNAYLDGEFILPCHRTFYSKLTEDFICHGETKEFGSDLSCYPLRLSNNNKSILLSLEDTKGNIWYSWFHTDK